MPHPTLRNGDNNNEVQELQNLLNRIGCLLTPDGDFGGGTERAVREAQKIAGLTVDGVAGKNTWNWLLAQPAPSPDMPTEAVTFIAAEEVGGRAYYDRHTAMPHWPEGESGITIGVGYDLRFQNDAFEQDWGSELTDDQMARLRPHLGKKGSQSEADALADIRIEFPVAWRIFTRNTLPEYADRTRTAFPGCDTLPPLCFGMLVSLVYNRGGGMNGDRRAEMRAIRGHIENGMPDQVSAERYGPQAPSGAGGGIVAPRSQAQRGDGVGER